MIGTMRELRVLFAGTDASNEEFDEGREHELHKGW